MFWFNKTFGKRSSSFFTARNYLPSHTPPSLSISKFSVGLYWKRWLIDEYFTLSDQIQTWWWWCLYLIEQGGLTRGTFQWTVFNFRVLLDAKLHGRKFSALFEHCWWRSKEFSNISCSVSVFHVWPLRRTSQRTNNIFK